MPLSLILRYLPQIGIALAIVGAVWYIDHKGYQRAKEDAERRQLVSAIVEEKRTRRIERGMLDRSNDLDISLGRKLDTLNTQGAATMAALQKGIHDDPRYSSPACALGDGVWRSLNEARARTVPGPAPAASSVTVELPAPASAH